MPKLVDGTHESALPFQTKDAQGRQTHLLRLPPRKVFAQFCVQLQPCRTQLHERFVNLLRSVVRRACFERTQLLVRLAPRVLERTPQRFGLVADITHLRMVGMG